MRPSVDALAAALYDYLGKAEPIVYESRRGTHSQRVGERDIDLAHFKQSWPNTSCMFTSANSISGQAFTDAWTTVIWRDDGYEVYCDGRRAYGVDRPNAAFMQDLANRSMADQRTGARRYHDEGPAPKREDG